jgi:hypothetical protein
MEFVTTLKVFPAVCLTVLPVVTESAVLVKLSKLAQLIVATFVEMVLAKQENLLVLALMIVLVNEPALETVVVTVVEALVEPVQLAKPVVPTDFALLLQTVPTRFVDLMELEALAEPVLAQHNVLTSNVSVHPIVTEETVVVTDVEALVEPVNLTKPVVPTEFALLLQTVPTSNVDLMELEVLAEPVKVDKLVMLTDVALLFQTVPTSNVDLMELEALVEPVKVDRPVMLADVAFLLETVPTRLVDLMELEALAEPVLAQNNVSTSNVSVLANVGQEPVALTNVVTHVEPAHLARSALEETVLLTNQVQT